MAGDLSEKQVRAITLLTAGQHGASVAECIGVTPQTLSRWRRNPKFLAALNEQKQVILQAAVDVMQASASEIAKELISLALQSESAEVRRKSCVDVMKIIANDLRPFADAKNTDGKLLALAAEAETYFAYAEAMKQRQLARSEVEFFESKD